MSEPQDVIHVQPSEICFTNVRVGPTYRRLVQFTNSLATTVKFTVRAGAPERYTLEPSSFSLNPRSSATLEVKLKLPRNIPKQRSKHGIKDVFHIRGDLFEQKFRANVYLYGTSVPPPEAGAQTWAVDDENVKLQSALRERDEEVRLWKSRAEETELQVNVLESRLEEAESAIKRFQSSESHEVLMAKIDSLQTELQQAEEAKKEALSVNIELEHRISELERNSEYYGRVHEELQNACPNLDALVAEAVERERAMYEQNSKKVLHILCEKDEELAEMAAQQEGMKEHIANCQSKLEAAAKAIRSAEDNIQQKIAEKRALSERMNNEVHVLREENDDLRKQVVELNDLRYQCQSLTEDLAAQTSVKEAVERDLNEYRRSLEDLRMDYVTAQRKLAINEERCDELERRERDLFDLLEEQINMAAATDGDETGRQDTSDVHGDSHNEKDVESKEVVLQKVLSTLRCDADRLKNAQLVERSMRDQLHLLREMVQRLQEKLQTLTVRSEKAAPASPDTSTIVQQLQTLADDIASAMPTSPTLPTASPARSTPDRTHADSPEDLSSSMKECPERRELEKQVEDRNEEIKRLRNRVEKLEDMQLEAQQTVAESERKLRKLRTELEVVDSEYKERLAEREGELAQVEGRCRELEMMKKEYVVMSAEMDRSKSLRTQYEAELDRMQHYSQRLEDALRHTQEHSAIREKEHLQARKHLEAKTDLQSQVITELRHQLTHGKSATETKIQQMQQTIASLSARSPSGSELALLRRENLELRLAVMKVHSAADRLQSEVVDRRADQQRLRSRVFDLEYKCSKLKLSRPLIDVPSTFADDASSIAGSEKSLASVPSVPKSHSGPNGTGNETGDEPIDLVANLSLKVADLSREIKRLRAAAPGTEPTPAHGVDTLSLPASSPSAVSDKHTATSTDHQHISQSPSVRENMSLVSAATSAHTTVGMDVVHVIEESLRKFGDTAALAARCEELEARRELDARSWIWKIGPRPQQHMIEREAKRVHLQQIHELQKNCARLSALQSKSQLQIEAERHRRTQCESLLSESSAELEAVTKELELALNKIQDLQGQQRENNIAWMRERQDLEYKCRERSAQNTQLLDTIDKLTAEHNGDANVIELMRVREDVSVSAVRREMAEFESHLLRKRLERVTAELQDASQELKASSAQLAGKAAESASLKGHVRLLSSELDRCRTTLLERESELESIQRHLQAVEDDYEGVCRERDHHKSLSDRVGVSVRGRLKQLLSPDSSNLKESGGGTNHSDTMVDSGTLEQPHSKTAEEIGINRLVSAIERLAKTVSDETQTGVCGTEYGGIPRRVWDHMLALVQCDRSVVEANVTKVSTLAFECDRLYDILSSVVVECEKLAIENEALSASAQKKTSTVQRAASQGLPTPLMSDTLQQLTSLPNILQCSLAKDVLGAKCEHLSKRVADLESILTVQAASMTASSADTTTSLDDVDSYLEAVLRDSELSKIGISTATVVARIRSECIRPLVTKLWSSSSKTDALEAMVSDLRRSIHESQTSPRHSQSEFVLEKLLPLFDLQVDVSQMSVRALLQAILPEHVYNCVARMHGIFEDESTESERGEEVERVGRASDGANRTQEIDFEEQVAVYKATIDGYLEKIRSLEHEIEHTHEEHARRLKAKGCSVETQTDLIRCTSTGMETDAMQTEIRGSQTDAEFSEPPSRSIPTDSIGCQTSPIVIGVEEAQQKSVYVSLLEKRGTGIRPSAEAGKSRTTRTRGCQTNFEPETCSRHIQTVAVKKSAVSASPAKKVEKAPPSPPRVLASTGVNTELSGPVVVPGDENVQVPPTAPADGGSSSRSRVSEVLASIDDNLDNLQNQQGVEHKDVQKPVKPGKEVLKSTTLADSSFSAGLSLKKSKEIIKSNGELRQSLVLLRKRYKRLRVTCKNLRKSLSASRKSLTTIRKARVAAAAMASSRARVVPNKTTKSAKPGVKSIPSTVGDTLIAIPGRKTRVKGKSSSATDPLSGTAARSDLIARLEGFLRVQNREFSEQLLSDVRRLAGMHHGSRPRSDDGSVSPRPVTSGGENTRKYIRSLKLALRDAQASSRELREQNGKSRKRFVQLQDLLNKGNDELRRLKKQLNATVTALRNSEVEKRQLQLLVNNYRESVGAAAATGDKEMERSPVPGASDIIKLSRANQDMRTEIEKLKRIVAVKDASIKGLSQEKENLSSTASSARNALRSVEDKASKLKADILRLQGQVASLKSSAKSKSDNHSATVEALQTKTTAYEKSARRLESDLSRLRAVHQETRSSLESERTANRDLSGKLDASLGKCQSLEKEAARLQQWMNKTVPTMVSVYTHTLEVWSACVGRLVHEVENKDQSLRAAREASLRPQDVSPADESLVSTALELSRSLLDDVYSEEQIQELIRSSIDTDQPASEATQSAPSSDLANWKSSVREVKKLTEEVRDMLLNKKLRTVALVEHALPLMEKCKSVLSNVLGSNGNLPV